MPDNFPERKPKIHLFENQCGRTFKNSSLRMDNTACKSNHGDMGLQSTKFPSEVTCKRCIKVTTRRQMALEKAVTPRPAKSPSSVELDQMLRESADQIQAQDEWMKNALDHIGRLKDGLRLALNHLDQNQHVLILPNTSHLTLGNLITLLLDEKVPDL